MRSTGSRPARWGRLGATIAIAAAAVMGAGTPAAAYTPAVTFAGIADYDDDGNDDIVARDRAGLLWLYPGQGTRGYSNQGRYQNGNG